MAGKRQATSNLNHENWDQDEEPEERGTFRKASEDELKSRVIKKARRKVSGNTAADADDTAPRSIFSGFAGFGKTASAATAAPSPFSFLSKISTPTVTDGNNADCAANASSIKPTFSFGTAGKKTTQPVSTAKKDDSASENKKSHALKEHSNSNSEKSINYQSKIKNLNQAVSEWIKTHVDKNPLCILSPIFKDYEKYLNEIEEEEKNAKKPSTTTNNQIDATSAAPAIGNFKFASSTTASGAASASSFVSNSNTLPTATKDSSSSIFSSGPKPCTETAKSNTFSFGLKSVESNPNKDAQGTLPPTQGFSFWLKNGDKTANATTTFTFGQPAPTSGDESSEKKPAPFSFTPGSTPFSFGNIKPPAAIQPSTAEGAKGNAEDEEDQPPKVEFKQVVEEDAVYSKKCKVFVKKDGAFADRGVGTLYLKPVKDSDKTQLLVRADTNLGNILVNLILSTGIPTQRMGKNNVMLVCLPTPDVEKVTSMLLRVKTAEEADELLGELEKYKK